jgi:SNF2 family DNA or RNA helicase
MIAIEQNFIYIQCNEATAKKLDAIWVKSRNAWRLPDTMGALRELHRLGFDVMEYGKQKAEQRKNLLEFKFLKPVTPLDKRLRPYQHQDINFLQELPHAAIFNEQRTGKTPTTLKLLEWEGHDKIIIICPASLVLNWEKEVKRWTEGYEVIAVSGTKKQRLKQYEQASHLKKGFLILSKDTAKADVDLLSPVNHVLVVDEAHFLRNYKTAQSKAVFQLGKNAVKRLALTGTPSVNSGDDIYGILHFLYPTQFPSYWQFVDRYFKTWDSPWGAKEVSGYKRKEELTEILDLISVQRKRSEVMQWIPAKVNQTFEVEMDAKQRKVYNSMLNTFIVEEDNDVKADAPSVLAQLTRLRQLCLSPNLLDIKAPSAKENFILEWIENNVDEPVIIFSNFSSYLMVLQRKIKGSRLIVGATSKQERQQTVEDFQNGKCNVILANIQAAGVGLTLDRASTVIFLDRAYTPTDNVQAEDRIVPTTEASNQHCTIIDVVCKDSIDQHINDLLKKKKSVIEVINNYKNIRELLGK